MAPSVHGMVLFAGSEVAGGTAATVLLGYNTETEPILMIPHVAGAFGYYGGGVSGAYARGLAGMKLGWAGSPELSVIMRGGYGHYRLGPAGSVHGAAFQSGPAVDYRLSRTTSVGGELLYDLFISPDSGDAAHAIVLGAAIGFAL